MTVKSGQFPKIVIENKMQPTPLHVSIYLQLNILFHFKIRLESRLTRENENYFYVIQLKAKLAVQCQ